MPTWPSGTKAGTTNVDNPTDLVANARADIKQNIDNVNDIIDTFNISSPNDGDLLQYSTSTGKWEQVTATSITSNAGNMVVLNADATDLNLDSAGVRQAGTFTIPITELVDPTNLISITNNQFVLPAGKYWVDIKSSIGTGTTTAWTGYNVTDSQSLFGFSSNDDNELVYFEIAGSKTVDLRIDTNANFTTSGQAYIRINKF